MNIRELYWIGNSKEELCSFPRDVRRNIGYALHFAQMGDKHPSVKVLKGFGGAGVLEVVENSEGGTYRAVYSDRTQFSQIRKTLVRALYRFAGGETKQQI